MANKRMFTMKIVDSDSFLDMPLSAQCLYFHLNMRADDDGFIGNPKRVMRIVGSNEDDLKLLIAKRFLLKFDDGVIVIKHWRMHNTLSQNRYHETQYLDEKSLLKLKKNGSYSFNDGDVINDSKLVGAKDKYDKSHRLTDGLQSADSGLDLDKGLGLDKDLDSDQDSGKGLESKSEKIKINKTKKTERMSELFERLLPNYEISDALADKVREWLIYKTERKEIYKEQGMKSLLTQILKRAKQYGDIAMIELIDECMASNWAGIIWDRLTKQSGNSYVEKVENRISEVDSW